MRPIVTLRWTALVGTFVMLGVAASACSASSGDPSEDNLFVDSGKGLKVPEQEICGNGIDDNDNGQVDENCKGCGTGGSKNTEVPGANGCGTGGSGSGAGTGGSGSGTASGGSAGTETTPDAGSGCVPKSPSETSCSDGIDDDCDGKVDCDDPDCRKPGQCGCNPTELKCGDGVDDDCDGNQDCADQDCKSKCNPGATRFCDDPNYCNWGQQTCGPDGNWGTCVEIPAPSGCEGMFWDNSYDSSCCVAQGYCCQAYPAQNSIGNCVGVDACP
jgi:hypothetical protein